MGSRIDSHVTGRPVADCVFCQIVQRKAPAEIVFEDDDTISFLDIYPLNHGHALVISKKHYATLDEMPPKEVGRLFESVAEIMRAVKEAVRADGINIGQSNGRAASQDVFHVHAHVIPRFSRDSPDGETFPDRKTFGESDREIAKQIRNVLNRNRERT